LLHQVGTFRHLRPVMIENFGGRHLMPWLWQ